MLLLHHHRQPTTTTAQKEVPAYLGPSLHHHLHCHLKTPAYWAWPTARREPTGSHHLPPRRGPGGSGAGGAAACAEATGSVTHGAAGEHRGACRLESMELAEPWGSSLRARRARARTATGAAPTASPSSGGNPGASREAAALRLLQTAPRPAAGATPPQTRRVVPSESSACRPAPWPQFRILPGTHMQTRWQRQLQH